MMRGKKVTASNIVGAPIRVVTRQSTDIYAVTDREVLSSLNFIGKHAGNRFINVDEVVASTRLSRRILEKRFQQYVGRTIGEEIRRIKIDTICDKLINTTHSVSQIAFEVGFESYTNISKYFKREKKISPMAFRRMFTK
jgi:LacI family transcriptional regulator